TSSTRWRRLMPRVAGSPRRWSGRERQSNWRRRRSRSRCGTMCSCSWPANPAAHSRPAERLVGRGQARSHPGRNARAAVMAPQPPPAIPITNRRALVKAVIASTVGTTIEWYDFFLYGAAAALVFPKLFFPNQGPFIGQILAFGTFTVGFIARPLGGVLFG